MLPDHYQTLGLKPGASTDDIRKAYKALVKVHHPDVVMPSEREKAADIFKEIMLAYQVLHSPDQRKVYDAQMMAMKAALNERVRQHRQKEATKKQTTHAPKAASPKAVETPKVSKKLADERRQGERGDPTWRNNPRHGDKINPAVKQKTEQKKTPQKEAPPSPAPAMEPQEKQDPPKPSILPWKRGETVFVVQHSDTEWHSTWMPRTKAWKKAVHQGMALFSFKDADSNELLLYTHIELPEDCTGDDDMLKLDVQNGVTLYLGIERLPEKKGWMSLFHKEESAKAKSRAQAKKEQVKKEHTKKEQAKKTAPTEKSVANTATSTPSTVAPPSPRLSKGKPEKDTPTQDATPEQPTLHLTPWEAVLGCEKQVKLPSGETGELKVPAGIQPDQSLRFVAQDDQPYAVLVKVRIPKSLSEEQREAYVILKALDQAAQS